MYDQTLLLEAMLRRGLNFYRLGRLAGVDPKTVKSILLHGKGASKSWYAIAKALGFDVKVNDFSAIMKKRQETQPRRRKSA